MLSNAESEFLSPMVRFDGEGEDRRLKPNAFRLEKTGEGGRAINAVL
jgi:hypothetical protein